MKKTVAAALTAAVVVGAASTTFAAGNPFVDVQPGHWAYDDVAKLADAGIVQGYNGNYFRGDRSITRYEMAAIIARVMAKNPSGVDKAIVDRLAAEFRDELAALGVRVAELEKYADKVVWTGELRYRYWKEREDVKGGDKIRTSNNQLQLRLFPTATVNDHWKLKARLTATSDMSKDTTGNVVATYAYAEGKYFDDKLTINVGRMPFYTNVDDGLVMDDFFSGAQVVYGDKFKIALMAGRWKGDFTDPSSYQGGELSYETDKFYIGAGYHHFKSDDFRALPGYKDTDSANVWTVGARYNLGDVNIRGSYANNTKAKEFKRSWTAGLAYKGADRKVAGSWGLSADYRYVSTNVSLCPTYDTWFNNWHRKGVEVGVDWAPIQNTYVKFGYFWGKTLDTKKNINTFFSRASWFF